MNLKNYQKIVNKLKKKPGNLYLPDDKKQILNLTEARINEIQKLEEIDSQLIRIQKSTKTTFKKLAPLHNFCRMKWQWYYKWSMNPAADKIHAGVLSMFIFASIITFSYGFFNKPSVTHASTTDCFWTNNGGGGDKKWSTATNWNCGHVPTNNDIAILTDNYSLSEDLEIDVPATAASISIYDYYGTITQNADFTLDNTNGGNGNFSIDDMSTPGYALAANKTLTVPGNFSTASNFTAWSGSTVDLTGTGLINLNGGAVGLYNLKVAHTGKTTTLAVNSNITVNGKLTLDGTNASNSIFTSEANSNNSIILKDNSDTPLISNGAIFTNGLSLKFYGDSNQNIPGGTFYSGANITHNADATHKLLGDITCYYLTVSRSTSVGRSILDTAGHNITVLGTGVTGVTIGGISTVGTAGTIINSTGTTDTKITTPALRIARKSGSATGVAVLDATANSHDKTINVDVSTNWINSDTFIGGTGTVTFIGSVSQIIYSQYNSNYAAAVNNTFNNLTYNSGDNVNTLSLYQYSGTPSLDINGRLTITKGTIAPGPYAITIAGGITFSDSTNGSITRTSGDSLTLDGNQTLVDNRSTKTSLGAISTVGAGRTITLGSSLKVDTLTIVDTDNFALGSNNYTLELVGNGATGEVLASYGTISAGTSTIRYAATNSGGNVTIAPGIDYSSVEFSGAETYDLVESITIHKNLTIDSGATLASSPFLTILLAGNWTNNGTFIEDNSTVYFNGTTDQEINGNGNNEFSMIQNNKNSGDIILNTNITLTGVEGNYSWIASSKTTTKLQNHTITVAGPSDGFYASADSDFTYFSSTSSDGKIVIQTDFNFNIESNAYKYNFGNIQVGDDEHDGTLTLQDLTNEHPTYAFNDLLITWRGALTTNNNKMSFSGNPVCASVCNLGTSEISFFGTGDSYYYLDTNVYDLNMDVSAIPGGKKIIMPSSMTVFPGHSWILNGDADSPLTLRSDTEDPWTFDISQLSQPYTSGSYIDVKDSWTGPEAPKIIRGTHVTDSGNNDGWLMNLAPDLPIGSAQMHTNEDYITAGQWINETSVVFMADVTDPNSSDNLSLCIEVEPVGDGFADEETCGDSVPYSTESGAVSASVTINNLTPGQYHWQAKTKDALGAESDWVSYSGDDRSFGIDTAAPIVTATPDPAPNGGYTSWYKSSPTINLSAIDNDGSDMYTTSYRWGSSGDYTTNDTDYMLLTANHEGSNDLYYYATDNAGNSSTPAHINIKLDTTAPTTNYSISPASPNGNNSYYKGSAPSVTLSGADGSGSGASNTFYKWGAGGSYSPYSGSIQAPEGTNTIYYYSVDNVGNSGISSPASQTIKVDTNAPTVTASTTPGSPNGSDNYFIGAAPSITLAPTDTVSGWNNTQYKWDDDETYHSYSTALTPSEGTHTLHFYAVDNAGNSGLSNAYSVIYNVETSPQDITFTTSPAAPNGDNGYYKTSLPSITLNATNNISGISAKKYHWDNETDQTYTGAFDAREGIHTLTYYAITAAGNESEHKTQSFKVDKTLPTIQIHANPSSPNGNNSYYKISPNISFTFNDGSGSGIFHAYYHWDSEIDSAYETSDSIPITQGHHTIYYHVVDNAGNSSNEGQAEYYVDSVNPTASISINPGAANGNNGFYKTIPTVTITGADTNGSGTASVSYRWGSSGEYTTVTSNLAGVLAPDGNPATLHYYVTDNAGNQSQNYSESYTVDTQAPTKSAEISPASPDGSDGYFVTIPIISLSAEDVASGSPTIYCWWNESAPESCNGPVSAPEETNTLHYYAIDRAGNMSSTSDLEFKVDSEAPPVSYAISPATPNGTNNYYKSEPTVTLGSEDSNSGLNKIQYKLNSGSYSDYSTPLIIPEGINTLYYLAMDNAGNTGQVQTKTISVDLTAPVLGNAPSATSPTNNQRPTWSWGTATDNGSGIAEYSIKLGHTAGASDVVSPTWIGNITSWTPSTDLTEGIYYLSVAVKDNTGNTSLYNTSAALTLDRTPPSGTIASNINGQYTTSKDVALTLSASDTGGANTVSQMALSNDGLTYSNWETYNTTKTWTLSSGDGPKNVYIKYKDSVGNISPIYSISTILDTTGPGAFSLFTPTKNSWTNLTTVKFTWEDAKDDISGLASYQFFLDDKQIGNDLPINTNLLTLSDLALGAHTFQIKAKDALGHETLSEKRSFGIDQIAPSKPSGLTLTSLTNESLKLTNQPATNLKWNDSTDTGGAGISNYLISIASSEEKLTNPDVLVPTSVKGTTFKQLLSKDGNYYASIVAQDSAGNLSEASTAYKFTLDTTKPAAVSNLRLFDVSNRVTGSYLSYSNWSATNDTGTGLKEYRVLEGNALVNTIPVTSTGVIPNSAALESVQANLKPGNYIYKVQAVDNAGNIGPASPDTALTIKSKDSFVPNLTNIKATPSTIVNSETAKTSALITWSTSSLATTQVLVDGKAYGNADLNLLDTGHSLLIPNLSAATTYRYQVISQDVYGNIIKSDTNSFRTNALVKKQSSLEIMLKSLQDIFSLFKRASAAALETLGIKPYQVAKGNALLAYNISNPDTKTYQTFITLKNANAELQRSEDGQNFHTIATPNTPYYIDHAQSSGKTYTYKIKGQAEQATLRPDNQDTQTTKISNPKLIDEATQISDDKVQVAITWQTDKPATSQLTYGQGAPTIETTKDNNLNMSHTVVLTNLKPGVTYSYIVKSASDNNLEAKSGNLTFTTPSSPKQESILQTIIKSLQDTLSGLTNWIRK